MENPFKINDKVMTKVKGVEVETTVAQVFNNEVEVKTAEEKLLWRTMHTVWLPGSAPIPKPAKVVPVPEVVPVVPVPQPVPDAGGSESQVQTAPVSTIEQTGSEVPATSEPTAELAAEPAQTPSPNSASKHDGKGRGDRRSGKRRNRGR